MKKTSVFKTFLRTSFMVIVSTFLIVACENKEKSKKETDSTTKEDSTITTGPIISADSLKSIDSTAFIAEASSFTDEDFRDKKIYVLKMTANQFKQVFKKRNENKMIKFEFEKKGDGWSMFAYATDEDGARTPYGTLSFHLQIATKSYGIDFKKTDAEYKEVVSRGQIKAWLGIATGTDVVIDDTYFKDDVWLTPCRRVSDNKIIFLISKAGTIASCPKIKRVGGGDLNPSPPDNPCIEYGCDNPATGLYK